MRSVIVYVQHVQDVSCASKRYVSLSHNTEHKAAYKWHVAGVQDGAVRMQLTLVIEDICRVQSASSSSSHWELWRKRMMTLLTRLASGSSSADTVVEQLLTRHCLPSMLYTLPWIVNWQQQQQRSVTSQQTKRHGSTYMHVHTGRHFKASHVINIA